ncbi:uncharacterized protein N7459_006604 [Penicillium hispanicum]|uniref:uncharacterized protein n=1 Tax=Penicillium hispanicum TaxID=1080232 RepID=UPI0025424DE2|nr:uncharacterized protein N7459_006604 [Penicillium hispanicum]KAJ5577640.1 hypothetical protein N7459_006604 [Penicillium hispanicum]
MQLSLTLLAAAVSQAAVSTASTLTPPVLPLIVRNPYLSTWLGNARGAPWEKWPMFYTGEEVGLSLMAHVPSQGSVYPLVGKPHDSLGSDAGYQVQFPEYLGHNYDASTTNFTYRIDTGASTPLDITVSFLSPITPTSTLRQSIPASYVTVDVHGEVDVNVYMDIDGRWLSGDGASTLNWQWDTVGAENKKKTPPTLQRWQIRRETELLLSEIGDRGEWGTLHFTGPANVRYESGEADKVRRHFASSGSLGNANDNEFRAIGDRSPVFAFSKSFSLGRATKPTSDSVTYTVALIQIPVIQYASARGLTLMRPLWESWFPTAEELLRFHYNDHAAAGALASNYSDQLAQDAYLSGADDYVDIVALSARQVMGATTFSGTPENPILFLKEISSDGNLQTIDVIFPAFPFFLYTNPRWLAYLLEPLIEHTLSGQYPNTYAMHDLGTHFPNATGHPDGNDEYMPVEECGNILIMGLAVANSLQYETSTEASSQWSAYGSTPSGPSSQSAGLFPLNDLQVLSGIAHQDGKWGGGLEGKHLAEKWVQRSYRLWKQWTGYLVEFSLEPANQLSTDDFAGWLALQTNLALKGIVGINAMSKLAELTGHESDASYFKDIADKYIAKWEEFGMSRDATHAKLAYDWYGSWTTIYNLYADAQLCFHLDATDTDSPGFVPRHIYQKQSVWYHQVRQKYGLPLDSRHLYTKTDWEFFSMAVTAKSVRAEILESVARWVNETVTDRPFTDLHNTEGDGGFPGPDFFARPVIGGHFAFLALERACGGRAMPGLSFLDEVDGEQMRAWTRSAEAAAAVFTGGPQMNHHGVGEL